MNYEFSLRKQKNSKNISIHIEDDGSVVVTAPPFVSVTQVRKILAEKNDWIENKIKEHRKSRAPRVAFKNGEKIPFLGESLKIWMVEKDVKNIKVVISSGELIIYANKKEQRDYELVRAAVISSFKKYFRSLVQESIETYNSHYRFKYSRIAIKDNKSNWGSCSTKGNLNFNWRLIFASIDIIDYVVIHELCHLKEHNHSDRFWKLVAEKCPDYQKKKQWLRTNGRKLRI